MSLSSQPDLKLPLTASSMITQDSLPRPLDCFYQGLKKVYKDSLQYLYAAKAPYEDILTAARAAEARQEDYKEAGGATS